MNKKKRIPLINGKYLCYTLLILVGEIALLFGAYALNVLDNVIGFIVLPFFGLFTVYTAYEAVVLALEAVSVSRDGIVVAGKNPDGKAVHFELDTLLYVYPCDQKGNRIAEEREVYENICLAFHTKDGKKMLRQTSRLTQKQLAKLRDELDVHHVPQD